jgi:hypothetical protein
MKRNIRVRWWSVVTLAALATGCVGSELEVPANHPGHPGARTGKVPKTTGLGPLPANEPVGVHAAPHSGAKH